MGIDWSKLKANKNCYTCDVSNNYVCFECECLFIEKNYPNYSYDDDFNWLPNKTIKQSQYQQATIMNDNWLYNKGYYNNNES